MVARAHHNLVCRYGYHPTMPSSVLYPQSSSPAPTVLLLRQKMSVGGRVSFSLLQPGFVEDERRQHWFPTAEKPVSPEDIGLYISHLL